MDQPGAARVLTTHDLQYVFLDAGRSSGIQVLDATGSVFEVDLSQFGELFIGGQRYECALVSFTANNAAPPADGAYSVYCNAVGPSFLNGTSANILRDLPYVTASSQLLTPLITIPDPFFVEAINQGQTRLRISILDRSGVGMSYINNAGRARLTLAFRRVADAGRWNASS